MVKKSSKKAKPRFDDDDDFIDDMKRTSNEASPEDMERQRGKRKSCLNFGNTGIEEEDVNWFTPKHGKDKNRIDIIPFKITQDWYKDLRIPIGTWEGDSKYATLCTGRKVGQQAYVLIIPVHFDVGTKGATKLCLREAFGGKCVICDEMFDKISEDKEKNKKIITTLKPKWRGFYNVRDRQDKEKGIQLWDIGFYNFERYLRAEVRLSDEGVTPFASLKEGKTLVFRGTQELFNKIKFIKVTSIDFADRKKPYKTSILDEVFSLDEMLIIPTYEDVRSAHFELEEGETEEEEEREDDIDDEKETNNDPDEVTEDDIKDMDKKELIQFIEDEDLDEDIEDYEDMGLSKLRKAVIEKYCDSKEDPEDELPEFDDNAIDEVTEEDINEMDKKELIQFIEDEDLDIEDVEDMKLSKLRKAIIEEHCNDNNPDNAKDEVTKEDIGEMDEDDLIQFIEDEDLDIEDPEDMSLSKLRKAVLKEHFGEEEKKTAKKSDKKKKFRRKNR